MQLGCMHYPGRVGVLVHFVDTVLPSIRRMGKRCTLLRRAEKLLRMDRVICLYYYWSNTRDARRDCVPRHAMPHFERLVHQYSPHALRKPHIIYDVILVDIFEYALCLGTPTVPRLLATNCVFLCNVPPEITENQQRVFWDTSPLNIAV